MIEGLSLLAVLIAFAGGLVSFVSPCVLPLVPIFLGHLSGVSIKDGSIEGGRTTFFHAIAFVVGCSIPFIVLGATIGVLGGKTAGGYADLIARIAGVILIVMGLYIAGFFRMPFLGPALAPITRALDRLYYREHRIQVSGEKSAPSYWRSIAVGGAFGVGWTPCITPVLGTILTLAFNEAGNSLGAWSAAGEAGLLLCFYAVGLSIPFLITGAAMGHVAPMFNLLKKYLSTVTLVTGILMVAVGILVYQNAVVDLNQYFDFLPYVEFDS